MAQTYSDVLYSIDRGVATITINRPSRMNALTAHTLAELADACTRAAQDHAVGVVVITGAGERAFCAGGDIEWEAGGGLDGLDYKLGAQLVDHPKPVIARVCGYALGGGNHLAYFCDITIAAAHSVFGQNGPRIGAPTGGYTVAHAAAILGHKRAREMEMLCRQIPASQALAWGLVNAVVPKDELDAEVRKWCDEMLTMSPSSLRMIKASFRRHMDPYLKLNLMEIVQSHAPDIFTSGEQQEGAQAFFEKRPPDFSRWR
jgi:2-ketocyclohexanecarboxyl-CoA hydrolase